MCRTGLFFVLALTGVGLTGCGEEDPCANKTCDFGTCDSATGQCVNVEDCQVDSECLPGYLCEPGGTCEPQTTCTSNSDCDAGVCENEACVNPAECSSDSDCVARTFCADDNTCQPDPCNNVTCNRGMCERGTDNCISMPSCTEQNEQYNCIQGEKCARGKCAPQASFCERLNCDRGVCDFSEGGCANAEDCEGDDANCSEGFYCNDMDRCAPNLCERNEVDCGANGVCMPMTGECQNASSCESSADCVEDHVCVEGSCRLESMACGDAGGDGGCPGNLECSYNETTLTAICQQTGSCETSLDCLKPTAQCGGERCLSAAACVQDRLEPNDSGTDVTNIADVNPSGFLEGLTLCGGDADLFTFNTLDFAPGAVDSTAVVTVTVPKKVIGLGEMNMVINGPNGRTFNDSLGAMGQSGEMEVQIPLSAPTLGAYQIRLTPGEEFNETSGLLYDLSVNIARDENIELCNSVDSLDTLEIGGRTNGTIPEDGSSLLGASCLPSEESSSEKLYRLEVPRPQEIEMTVDGATEDDDPSISVRERCLEVGSEVACVDDEGPGESETLSRVFSEGSYLVVVQAGAGGSDSDGTLTDFTLTTRRTALTTCNPGERSCADQSTSRVCSTDGGTVRRVDCDAGCNPATGSCYSPDGDTCEGAPTLRPRDANMMSERGYPMIQQRLEFLEVANSYSPTGSDCSGLSSSRTGGPDRVYKVSVPSGKAVTVDANYGNSAEGSIYFAETCPDIPGSCTKGGQGTVSGDSSRETLTFSNRSGEAQERYVVVDTAADQNLDVARVSISFPDIICEGDEQACNPEGDVGTCNEAGTAFASTTDCSNFGCVGATCAYVNNTCNNVINVTRGARNQIGGISFSAAWNAYTNDYEGEGCGVPDSDTESYESVYKVDLRSGDILQARLTSSGAIDADPGLHVADTCAEVTEDTCIAADYGGNEPAEIEYEATSNETVYLFADADDKADDEEFTMNVNITREQQDCIDGTHTPTCVGDSIQLCGEDRPLYTYYSCDGGCFNGRCGFPRGERCLDAKPLSDGATESNDWVGSNSIDPAATGNTGSCSFDAGTAGADWVYSVQLDPGETLVADIEEDGFFAPDTVLYFLRDCADTSTCFKARSSEGELTYTAGGSRETIYVVADTPEDTDNSFDGYELDISVNAP